MKLKEGCVCHCELDDFRFSIFEYYDAVSTMFSNCPGASDTSRPPTHVFLGLHRPPLVRREDHL